MFVKPVFVLHQPARSEAKTMCHRLQPKPPEPAPVQPVCAALTLADAWPSAQTLLCLRSQGSDRRQVAPSRNVMAELDEPTYVPGATHHAKREPTASSKANDRTHLSRGTLPTTNI
jgi:hypothetical protein